MSTILCLGIAVQDYVFSLDEMPKAAEKYRAKALAMAGGGCAATAAVAVARLGGKARLAARVGDDPIGDQIVAELESYGVDCALARRFAGRRSSLSAVFVDADGERMIVNYRDPDLSADPGWLPDPLPGDIDAVLADTRWAEGAAAILKRARAAGRPGILDAEAPTAWAGEAIGTASHLAFSAEGLRDYSGSDDLVAALGAVAVETGAWASVTDGAEGTWWTEGEGIAHLPSFEVEAVDTLGAGDVWHGAFALALGEGRSEADAVAFASAAASLKCTRFGGRAGAPDRAETEAFLAERTRGNGRAFDRVEMR